MTNCLAQRGNGLDIKPQATQTNASGTLLDNADLLLQLYHLGGIPLGPLLKPAWRIPDLINFQVMKGPLRATGRGGGGERGI